MQDEKIRYSSKSWVQIRADWHFNHPDIEAEGYRDPMPARRNVKRSAVLIRFRKFIEGEQLSSALITEFLASFPHWWLLTTDTRERDHAREVLDRLWIAADEAENGDLYTEQKEA